MTEENFDIFNADLDSVEAGKDFSAVKPGVYGLKVEDVKVERDDQGRVVAAIRESITTEGVETIIPGATPGNIFNRLWFHTPKTLGFIRRFVDSHGGNWEDFKAQIAAAKGTDLVEALTAILNPYLGSESRAKVGYDGQYKKNEIDSYLVTKQAA